MKRTLHWIATVLIILFVSGCGPSNNQELTVQEIQTQNDVQTINDPRDLFMTEEITLPHESIICEKIYNDTLFYMNYVPEGSSEAPWLFRAGLTGNTLEETGIPVTIPAEQQVDGIAVDPVGSIHLLTFQYEGVNEERFIDAFWLKLAEDGTITESLSLGEYFTGEDIPYANGFEIDEDGRALVAAGSVVYVFGSDGSLVFKADCSNYIHRMFKDEQEGTVYVQWSKEGVATFTPVDVQSQTMGADLSLIGLDAGYIVGMDMDADKQLRIATEGGVYRYDMAQNALSATFDWFDLDIAMVSVDSILPLSDGRMMWIDRQNEDPAARLSVWIIRERTMEEQRIWIAEKEQADLEQEETTVRDDTGTASDELDLAALGTGDITLGIASHVTVALEEAIVKFNQNNPKTRIEVIQSLFCGGQFSAAGGLSGKYPGGI